MYCPNCSRPRPGSHYQCPECGGPLLLNAPRRQGKLWPALIILAVMLLIGGTIFIFSLPHAAEESPVSETPWFTVSNGTLSFDPSQYTGGETLTVPSVVNGQTVTRLSARCFSNCDTLVTVELPDTLTVIGVNAFSGCTSLRGLKLPERVHSIGKNAFLDCAALEAIYIPASVTVIGDQAFDGCDRLIHIFFTGDFLDWEQLYPGELPLDAEIYTVSGPDAESFSPS